MSPDHITASAYNRDIDKRLEHKLVCYARLGHIDIPTSQTKAILRNQAFGQAAWLKRDKGTHQIHET